MEKEQDNSYHKINLNWYPGHMAKTKREITEDLKLIDVVVELLDSRIPMSSQNPDLAELTKGKKKIIVLNKTDLADNMQNEAWKKYFNSNGQVCILTDSNLGKGINDVTKAIEGIMKEDLDKYAEKGRTGRKIKAMILGIPNVGKSSFINRIVKTNRLEVGNKPGVTRKKQWISINDKINLLDTPGVLWPKFEDENVALKLSYVGSIKDEVLDEVNIAYNLLKYLYENYKEKIFTRYQINEYNIEESDDLYEQDEVYNLMRAIGRKRGAIVSGRRNR